MQNGCACQELHRVALGPMKHRQICECLRLALMQDSVDVGNLSCFEQMSRRMVQLEMAEDKNPKHPDFAGLGVLVDATTTSSGAARMLKFTSWVTVRQKEQAGIYKQRCPYTEEHSKSQQTDGHGGAESKRAQKPKPKPKAS